MRADDPDHLLTLFRLGFEVDEQLDERLLELKQSGADPGEIFPDLEKLTAGWSPDKFEAWLRNDTGSDHAVAATARATATATARVTATVTGRRLAGQVPKDLCEAASQLAAALLPINKEYVLPHFRTGR